VKKIPRKKDNPFRDKQPDEPEEDEGRRLATIITSREERKTKLRSATQASLSFYGRIARQLWIV